MWLLYKINLKVNGSFDDDSNLNMRLVLVYVLWGDCSLLCFVLLLLGLFFWVWVF